MSAIRSVGRRPVILISCLGLSLDHLFMALAPTVELLFVGRIVSGITSATLAVGGGLGLLGLGVVPPGGEEQAHLGQIRPLLGEAG